ncbi:hypothetical protein UVI_02029840 [Ustilaginoidea virens]|uniref:Uncharacterized protein n=1 Tax=Ustilaginoidea virens TaxID=1159556 RepID=A0A1B5L899_USTVR|nr:hypothetical protein UVI_02029840 [Ustilaginoidea virens]
MSACLDAAKRTGTAATGQASTEDKSICPIQASTLEVWSSGSASKPVDVSRRKHGTSLHQLGITHTPQAEKVEEAGLWLASVTARQHKRHPLHLKALIVCI